MKVSLSRMWRSGMALLLAICIVVGFVPSVAFAEAPESIKYVSLGDSMTNGYGLPGYDGNTGVEDYGNGSYANLFAEWLGRNGATVEHAQLAMSAMRAEDLHWLLELDYNDAEAIALTDGEWDEAAWNAKFSIGDFWTWNELCDDYRFAVAASTIVNGDPNAKIRDDEAVIVAKYYQESVKNADVVSLAIGNGNFGVFAFGRIMEAIGFSGTPDDAMVYNVERALDDCDPALKAQILALKETMTAKAEEYLTAHAEELPFDIESVDAMLETPTVKALINTMVYTGLSYVLNYAGTVDAILELNPDADIILVALMNTFGSVAEQAGADPALGDLLDYVYTPLNAYIAGLPTVMKGLQNGRYAEADFYYAEAESVQCLVDVYEEQLNNPDSVIRPRFVESIVGTTSDPGMVWGLMGGVELVEGVSLVPVTLEEIQAYEALDDVQKAAYAAGNTAKAVSISVYLAFENAIKGAGDAPVSLSSIMGLGGLGFDMFAPVMADFMANAETDGMAHLDAASAAVAGIANNLQSEIDFTPAMVKALVAGGADAQAIIDEIAFAQATAGINAAMNQSFTVDEVKALYNNDEAYGGAITAAVNTAKAAVKEMIYETYDLDGNVEMICMLLTMPTTLSNSLQKDATVKGLLGLFARCVIGNGLGAHPSAGGHEALFNAVKDAYESGYTAQDKTMENAQYALDELLKLLEQYGPDALEQAYKYAEENGYIDALEAALENAKTELAAKAAEFCENAKPEIEAQLAALEAQLEEMYGQLEALKAELEAKKAELVAAGEAAAQEAIAKIEAAIAKLEALIAEVEENIAAAEAAIESLKQKLAAIEAELAQLAEDIKALDEAVKALVETMKSADTIEKVAEAVETARAAAVKAAKQLKATYEAIVTAIDETGTLAEQIAKQVATVAEQVKTGLEAVAALIGENVAQGVEAAIEAAKEAAEAAIALVNADLSEALAAVNEELGAKIEEAMAALNAKVAEIEAEIAAASAELAAALAEKKAELEALQAELAAKLGELDAAVAEKVAELEALQAELVNAAEEAKAAIEAKIAEVQAAIAELEAQIAAVKAEAEAKIAEVQAAVAELEAQIAEIRAEIEAAYAETVAALEKAVNELNAELEAQIAELNAAAEAKIAEINAELEAKIAELNAAVEGAIEEALAAVEAAVEEVLNTVDAAITEAAQKLNAAVEEALAQLDALVNEKIAEVVKAAQDALVRATTADLVIDDAFKYVALGDASAGEYVAKLEAALNEEAAANGVTNAITTVNAAKAGNTITAEIANLSADVADADLITIGFSQAEILAAAAEGAKTQTTYDWVKLVGEDAASYIQEALEKIKAEIVAMELAEDMEKLMLTAIEGYAYGAVEYALALPVLVQNIRAVNTEAVILVIGTYNPVEGVAIDAMGMKMDLAEMDAYFGYFVDALTVYSTGFAVVTEEVSYVEAPEVSITDNKWDIYDLLALMDGDPSAMLPDAEGSDYIAKKLTEALNITYVVKEPEEPSGLLGNADGNGVVNIRDAMRVMQYANGAIASDDLAVDNCDVDGRNGVNIRDAMLIMQYANGAITKFPIE